MRRGSILLAALAALVLSLTTAGASVATPAASNPLANVYWGNYTANADPATKFYNAETDPARKALLGKIALQPRMRWFGSWIANGDIQSTLTSYIKNAQTGHPGALVQMAIFRLLPAESQARTRLPTTAEQASYKQWINRAAAAIGSHNVAIDLQPDLPVWTHEPNNSRIAVDLVSYAAQKFASLANTTVYINAGSADWLTVSQAVTMLRHAGVRYVRGFTLADTHYDGNNAQIEYGTKIVNALSAVGLKNKHFVINSTNNGRPFTHPQFHGSDFDNAPVCPTNYTRTTPPCVTLGVPPTTNVTALKWHLTADARTKAGKYLDAFLWIGRPWLIDQAGPWSTSRALQLARSTPF